jgi:hypothetical protein
LQDWPHVIWSKTILPTNILVDKKDCLNIDHRKSLGCFSQEFGGKMNQAKDSQQNVSRSNGFRSKDMGSIILASHLAPRHSAERHSA